MERTGQIAAFAAGRGDDVAGLLREVGEQVDRLTGALRELSGREVEAEAAGGGIRVRVSGAGRLLAVTVGARAMRDLDHEELGRAVVEAIGRAREAAGAELAEALAETTGTRPPDPADPDGVRVPADPLAPALDALLRGA
ncbi:YbaB/EbfC family nucleoid-associated protein [Planomonospora sp. ID82291]|uniref:YbaB/EbfC family nucleoid-associated protein n=1 Tax=Planomonospora sp. ID82291 TaxID=2738136 RepID=UPI0018C42F5D|nr:YbaB/EbfC family nucleoid-associated protein [Planomonospora sp. ID82291]MBG0815342.1 YbaB/EbfC family nucleoid-associated protein [Planomonospora sp. ID82291]